VGFGREVPMGPALRIAMLVYITETGWSALRFERDPTLDRFPVLEYEDAHAAVAAVETLEELAMERGS
jgi:hypothetical protein